RPRDLLGHARRDPAPSRGAAGLSRRGHGVMLRVENLEGFYGVSQALFGMAFAVDAGEVVTLMGRNGMGKTTTVHAVMGLLPARRGLVEFEGRRVDQLPAFRIARLGLRLAPDGRHILPKH